MQIFAHRGASARAPENTLAAIKMALAVGVDGIEIDLRLTKDEEVVVFHDDTLARMAPEAPLPILHREITDLTLRQIQQADVGQGQRVPTFEEALFSIPRKKIVILDIKQNGPLLQKVEELIGRQKREVYFVCFDFELLQKIKHMCPEIPAFFSAHTKDLEEERQEVIRKALFFEGICLEMGPLVTKKLVDLFHAVGKKLGVWVHEHPAINDTAETVSYCREIGVDYFISNLPEGIL